MRGRAFRAVTIPSSYVGTAKDPFSNVRSGFEGETTTNRKDYGIVWNAALETGGPVSLAQRGSLCLCPRRPVGSA